MLQRTTKVLTASGKIVKKSECCTINGAFYIKDVEAVKVGLTWFLKNDPRIFYDYSTHSWRKTRGLNICQGIVDKDSSGKYIYGAFVVDHSKNISVNILGSSGETRTQVVFMNKDLMGDTIFFNKNLGVYEDRVNMKPVLKSLDNLLANTIGYGNYDYTFSQEYSSSKHLETFLNTPRDLTKLSYQPSINKEDLAQFGNLSFGLEFETAMGKISQKDCFNLGLIPLKDGSIKGIEYTTIPMQGEDGFKLLINQIKLLQKSAMFDKDCSLHLHLGGFPIESRSIWALYKLLLVIEPRIAEIMPKWAFNTARFKSKQKDYCLPLKKFSSFEEYYSYCSGDRLRFDGNLRYPHPLDEEDRAKWNIHARYVWANLINLLFKHKGKTAEFRVHAPTFNIQKIINWMFICAGILHYAIKHKDTLLASRVSSMSLTLEDLISAVYTRRIQEQLISYINQRKAFFNLSANKYNDPAGLLDLRLDEEEDYKTNLITNVRWLD